jgi:REP element-mobilizing transposase RayT
MKYDPKVHHRRSIRLPGYDYSLPGAYYVTLCAFRKKCLFGSVVGGQMQENEWGRTVREQWLDSARVRRELELDAFIVMPNHLHGILWILGPKGEHVLANNRPERRSAPQLPLRPMGRTPFGPTAGKGIPPMRPHSLASWASAFKAAVTSRIRKQWKEADAAVWQEDYYERIIRNEEELAAIREYILSNPTRWNSDPENPEADPDAEDEPPWGRDDDW